MSIRAFERGFLFKEKASMIRSRETSCDELTGTPIALPLLPNGLEGEHSWHHPAHPRDHEALQDMGGKAVRNARIQWVEGPGGTAALLNEADEIPERTGIHHKYHLMYEGPRLPETNQQKFGYLLMMLADYIPELGIDLSKKYPFERRVKPEEVDRLRSGELRVGSYAETQDFFSEYLLFNGQEYFFDSKDVEDFLSTSRGSQRFLFGDRLIGAAALNAVQPWIRPYKEARRKGLLRPDAGSSVLDIVQKAFGRETTRQKHIEKMYAHLAALATQTQVQRPVLIAA